MGVTKDPAFEANLAYIDKIINESGLSEKKKAKFSEFNSFTINSLPKKGTFKCYEYSDNIDCPTMNHVRMVTECGYSISLSALTRVCLYGESLKNPLFIVTPDYYLFSGDALLAGQKCISPELEDWIVSNGLNAKAVAMELVGKSFTATPVQVANYYHNNKETRVERDQIDEINKPENLTERLSKLVFSTIYTVVLD